MAIQDTRPHVSTDTDRGVGSRPIPQSRMTPETSNTNSVIAAVIAALVVLGGIYYYYTTNQTGSITTPSVTQTAPAPADTPATPPAADAPVIQTTPAPADVPASQPAPAPVTPAPNP
jgi:hypothetical protein